MLKLSIFLCLQLIVHYCCAQQLQRVLRIYEPGFKRQQLNDSVAVQVIPGICKNNGQILFYLSKMLSQEKSIAPKKPEKHGDIQASGNVLYDFSYRSYLDTPFAQKGLMQNSITTSLSVTIKEKYPVKVNIGIRTTNSPFFKDRLDINFSYQQKNLIEIYKNELKQRYHDRLSSARLAAEEQKYSAYITEAQRLKGWLTNPVRLQEIIEEKENKVLKKGFEKVTNFVPTDRRKTFSLGDKNVQNLNWEGFLAEFTGLNKVENGQVSKTQFLDDSSMNRMSLPEKEIKHKKDELATVESEIQAQGAKVRQIKKNIRDSISGIQREISSLNSRAELYDFMKRNGVSTDSLSKIQKLLLSIHQINVGRFYLNYSELTVKDISLTGVNVVANPGLLYFAVAAGKINYNLRDFVLKRGNQGSPRHFYMVRTGIGKIEKNNLILSFYKGRKGDLLNPATNLNHNANKVFGISLESKIVLNPQNYIIAEVAKSSYGSIAGTSINPDSKNVFDLNTRTNEAYSVKLFSQFPLSHTRFSGSYRKMGENFESFYLYPSHSSEASWTMRLNQEFWRKTLTVEAGVRKNEFNSPVAVPSEYSATMIFKSFQATLRIPKYPFVSIGFYPSSQLSFSEKDLLIENQYNTLNAIISHNYHVKTVVMNTAATFTKFYNSSTDTGFIYFNSKNWNVSHSATIYDWNFQASVTVIEQQQIKMMTLEETLGYNFKNRLALSAGVKWNKLNRIENLWGGTAALNLQVKKIGAFQFRYEKVFLPTYQRQLTGVDMGRMSFYKVF